MEQTKDWYKSKTVWAGIVTAVVGVLAMFGVGAAEGEEAAIVEVIMQVVTVVGGILAIIGRLVAKSRLKGPGGGVGLLLVLCLAGVMASVAGCGGVQTSPEYSALLDRTAAWSRAVADKAAAGEMTGFQMTEALEINADLWGRFEDAKNGVATEGGGR